MNYKYYTLAGQLYRTTPHSAEYQNEFGVWLPSKVFTNDVHLISLGATQSPPPAIPHSRNRAKSTHVRKI